MRSGVGAVPFIHFEDPYCLFQDFYRIVQEVNGSQVHREVKVGLAMTIGGTDFFRRDNGYPKCGGTIIIMRILVFLGPVTVKEFIRIPSRSRPVTIYGIFLDLNSGRAGHVVPLENCVSFRGFVC